MEAAREWTEGIQRASEIRVGRCHRWLHLVEARLCGELRDGGADLPQHLLRTEVVAFGVVHLDLKPFRANLWEKRGQGGGGATDSAVVWGLGISKRRPCMPKNGVTRIHVLHAVRYQSRLQATTEGARILVVQHGGMRAVKYHNDDFACHVVCMQPPTQTCMVCVYRCR